MANKPTAYQNAGVGRSSATPQDWEDSPNLAGANSPGIGINIGGGAVVGEAQQFTLLDQRGVSRTPQLGAHLGPDGGVGVLDLTMQDFGSDKVAPTQDGATYLNTLAAGWESELPIGNAVDPGWIFSQYYQLLGGDFIQGYDYLYNPEGLNFRAMSANNLVIGNNYVITFTTKADTGYGNTVFRPGVLDNDYTIAADGPHSHAFTAGDTNGLSRFTSIDATGISSILITNLIVREA